MSTRGDPTQHANDFWTSYIGSSVIVNVGGAPISNPTVLAPGRYVLYCRETSLYMRQGGADVAVTDADQRLDRGTYRDLTVDDIDNGFLQVLTAEGLAGVLRITRTSAPVGGVLPGTPAQHQIDYWTSYIGPTTAISMPSSTPERSGLIPAGRYLVYCKESALYLLQGGSGVVANDNQFLLEANTYRDLTVDDTTNGYLAALAADGVAGTLRITKTSAES